jgi:phage tail-like protein
MDANGTRFQTLLGHEDWAHCFWAEDPEMGQEPLSPLFAESASSPPKPSAFAWDDDRYEITLRPVLSALPPVKNENAPRLEDRRGAARDRYGNWYWIDQNLQEIKVNSSGSQVTGHFWSTGDGLTCERDETAGGFATVLPPIVRPLGYSGLTVTEDHYLVVGVTDPAGLLLFDLHAGGPPQQILWPAGLAFVPFDMAPRVGGGLWILDRDHKSVWALDRHFRVIQRSQSSALVRSRDFRPLDENGRQTSKEEVAEVPLSLSDAITIEARDPIAVEALPDGSFLILDREPTSGANFSVIRRHGLLGETGNASLESMKDKMDERQQGFKLIGHDFAFVKGSPEPESKTVGRLYVTEQRGNQSYAFDVKIEKGGLNLEPRAEFYPMRLFGGKGLIASGGGLYYDFAERWIPLIQQKRPRYHGQAYLFTPGGFSKGHAELRKPLDGHEPDCVWHRLMLDACIPPEAKLQVSSRAANSEWELQEVPWQTEPPLYRRRDGSELPFVDTLSADYSGTWELLFQRAKGRYLQLRLRVKGNGRNTPRIRALRAYYPRFSYLHHYLPAVYREDPTSASFLDRFLANLEGFYTATEDKVAAVQLLFDRESVPTEYLDWLAGWYGLVFDRVMSPRAKRLAIRYAMVFFQYRGTMRGIEQALRLLLDECPDDSIFADGLGQRRRPANIRIVEKFLTRRAPGVVFGDPTDLEGPRMVVQRPRWQPSEGADSLHKRYQEAIGPSPTERFPIRDPGGPRSAVWRQFALSVLGFIPLAATEEESLWQTFLEDRYHDIEMLNLDYGTTYQTFAEVPLPETSPIDGKPQSDWDTFIQDVAPLSVSTRRRLWQDFLVRRYRRVSALNQAYATNWVDLTSVSLPSVLPNDGPALRDWYQFESVILAMQRNAHRFTVMLPTPRQTVFDPAQLRQRRELAERIIQVEKPAHTVFDVKFYWAMFRVGEARLGEDTLTDLGSRAPDLMPPIILGQGSLAQGYLAPTPGERMKERQLVGYRYRSHAAETMGDLNHEQLCCHGM